ncbi:uncharacterized protein Dana_GF26328 [Drosophila ananassae]|uniref:Kazal-like domain-containing protein n=1 Tax=Drosophila ananassae TaxID=7217 RepID=A0A0P9BX25_DROAN|nr:uncharacterized protein LOC26513737 isoform X2 [Drosophila ananassae]KPU76066.1 uncharacterized protein Dana_GF26328 [Drosophila ananassae]
MKASLIASFILVVIFVVAVSSQNSHENDEGSQSCRRKVQRSCTSSSKSCGRLGKANICTSFENDCQRQLSNCDSAIPTKFYRKVNSNLCRGLPKNTPKPCGSGSKSNNSYTPIIKA